jgi:1-acyl-sn-glycerol-3-phosphate acyltransferase
MRKLWCIFVACAWTTVLFTPCLIGMILTWSTSHSMWWVQKVWAPVLLWAGGAKLEVQGVENLPPGQSVILVSNHQSTLDIPALFVALPIDFRFVSKRSLKYVPVMGWYMTLAKFVFIDRGNKKSAIESLEKTGAQVRGGVSVVLFPEGTRSDSGEILPFKKGPFALAVKAAVPVVPITVEGTRHIMPKNSWDVAYAAAPVKVMIGKPIDPKPFGEDREALMRQVRDVIIDQSVALGGPGGNKADAIARRSERGGSSDADDKDSVTA